MQPNSIRIQQKCTRTAKFLYLYGEEYLPVRENFTGRTGKF
jgi:hypothetical protein